MRFLAKKMRRLVKEWHGVWPTTARRTRSTPSPACGGGLGRGWHARMSLAAWAPPPPPPPRAGGGGPPGGGEGARRRAAAPPHSHEPAHPAGAGEIKERRGTFVEARAQQRGEIVLVAVGALNLAEARGARRLGGVAPDGECRQRDERVAPGMAVNRARGIRARHHHRAQPLAREFEIDGLDAQERRERDVVAARAQAGGGALAILLRPWPQPAHALTPMP